MFITEVTGAIEICESHFFSTFAISTSFNSFPDFFQHFWMITGVICIHLHILTLAYCLILGETKCDNVGYTDSGMRWNQESHPCQL